MNDITTAVKDYALAHYATDGWDYVVECYSDAEIADVIKTARTAAGAIKMMRAQVKPRADYRKEIASTAL